MVTIEQHSGLVAMATTQPNFMTDLQIVNNSGAAVTQSTGSTPQNLPYSQSSEVQLAKDSTTDAPSTSQPDIPSIVSQDVPLSLAKVLLPAQVAVVANPFPDQATQQPSVLFQALTAQAASHFITLSAVPTQESTREDSSIQTTQSTSCIQFIDEGGGSNVFSTPNSQMTTFSVYTAPETTAMFAQNSTAYFNASGGAQNFAQISIAGNQVQDSGRFKIQEDSAVHSFNEEQNVFHVLDESNPDEPENSQIPCFPSSRMSTETMNWLLDNYEMAEGMSVPRSSMYTHYLKHCSEMKMEPLNPASFGKLIRAVFTGLRTRRLGTRGNSKYHYYGIRVKSGSPKPMHQSYRMINMEPIRRSKINQIMKSASKNGIFNLNKNGEKCADAHGERDQDSKELEDGNDESNDSDARDRDPKDSKGSGFLKKKFAYGATPRILLGDPSAAIPDVTIDCSAKPLPEGMTLNHVLAFKLSYTKHCEAILEAVVDFQFAEVQSIWKTFWNSSPDNEGDNHLSEHLIQLLAYDPIQNFIKETDYKFYQNIVDVLIPDVLRPIPSTLTQAIRNFAKSLEGWLKAALSQRGEDILNIKLSAISAFAQTLRRYTSLNHLAQAARAVLQSPVQINQMITDLSKVDFRNIQEQASWVCQCEDDSVHNLLSEFKETLKRNLWLEEWASWLECIAHRILKPYEGKPTYTKAARQFLLKWSFYSSLVIRDLTLRSASSFGSFHLLRLLYDEYMFFVIEHFIAKETNTTSIAVMAEYLCSGQSEGLIEAELLKCNQEISSESKSTETEQSDIKVDEI